MVGDIDNINNSVENLDYVATKVTAIPMPDGQDPAYVVGISLTEVASKVSRQVLFLKRSSDTFSLTVR